MFAVSCFTCVLHYRWQTKGRCLCVSHAGRFSKNSSRWSCFTSRPAEKRCDHFNNISEVMQQTGFLGCFTTDSLIHTYTHTHCAELRGKKDGMSDTTSVCTFVNAQRHRLFYSSSPHVVGCKNANTGPAVILMIQKHKTDHSHHSKWKAELQLLGQNAKSLIKKCKS